MNTWTSEPIHLSADLCIDVQASTDGVTCRKSVEGVYASDSLLTPEQAEQYGKALIQAAAECRVLRAGGAK